MIKRFIDIILSTTTILILSPLLIPIIVILKLTGEGYIFYKQERIGQNGTPFNLLKFATMFKDSPNMTGGNITAKMTLVFFLLGNSFVNIKLMNCRKSLMFGWVI